MEENLSFFYKFMINTKKKEERKKDYETTTKIQIFN